MNTQDEWLGVDAWALAGAFDELEQCAQAEQAQGAAKRLALEAEAAAERQRQEDEAREHRRLIREAGRNGRREARRKLGADVFAVNPDQIYQEWFHGGGSHRFAMRSPAAAVAARRRTDRRRAQRRGKAGVVALHRCMGGA